MDLFRPAPRCCGFCAQPRTSDRLIIGESGAVICDDCVGLSASVFLTRRAEAREAREREAQGGAAWATWGGAPPPPAGVPVYPLPPISEHRS